MLFKYSSYEIDYSEFVQSNSKIIRLWEAALSDDLVNEFLNALYYNSDISEGCSKLASYEKYPEYAELFMYENAETTVSHMMLDISLAFVKI